MDISSALTMEPGVKGLTIEGKVTFIGAVKEMTSEKGTWNSQFIIIAESQGVSCPASVKIEGDEIDETMKGRVIKLLSCKVADTVYKDKPSKIIYANGGWTPPDASAKLAEVAAPTSARAESEPSPFKQKMEVLKDEPISQRDRLILRQVALKAAVECSPAKATEFNAEVVTTLAQFFDDWLNKNV